MSIRFSRLVLILITAFLIFQVQTHLGNTAGWVFVAGIAWDIAYDVIAKVWDNRDARKARINALFGRNRR